MGMLSGENELPDAEVSALVPGWIIRVVMKSKRTKEVQLREKVEELMRRTTRDSRDS